MSERLRQLCEVHEAGLTTLTRLGGEVKRSGTVTASFSGLPAPPFNGIYAWQDDPDVEADLRALIAAGEARDLPMAISVQTGAAHEATVDRLATELGFFPAGDPQPAMVLTGGQIPPLPNGVRSSSPDSAEELDIYARLMADAFGFPLEVARAATHRDTLEWDDVEWFLLWDGDVAVATSMLIHVGDVASVVNVGVPTEHRRRGLGAAATWEVVRRGRERGATEAQLFASPMGEPVYLRMGFEIVGHMTTFVRP